MGKLKKPQLVPVFITPMRLKVDFYQDSCRAGGRVWREKCRSHSRYCGKLKMKRYWDDV